MNGSHTTAHVGESCRICMSHVTYGWVMSHMDESCHIWMSHVTYGWVMSHMDESCHTWLSHVTRDVSTSLVTSPQDVRSEIGRLRTWSHADVMSHMSHWVTSDVIESRLISLSLRLISGWMSTKKRRPIRNRTLSDWLIDVRFQIEETSAFTKKSGKNRGKSDSLKSRGPVVRPLWRTAGSGAKAPALAARPFEFVPRNLSFSIWWILGV